MQQGLRFAETIEQNETISRNVDKLFINHRTALGLLTLQTPQFIIKSVEQQLTANNTSRPRFTGSETVVD